jgi:hypothetical protein
MFVGMDVHKNYLQVAVLDEKGKVLRITYIGYGTPSHSVNYHP